MRFKHILNFQHVKNYFELFRIWLNICKFNGVKRKNGTIHLY